jgi:enamine deaminase RidA (YjgF/YER057c/UK114 family)
MDRQRISSGGPWEEAVGYSRAIRVGRRVYVAGTTAIGPDGKLVGLGDPGAQTREAFAVVERALRSAGARLSDVVRTRLFVTDISRWEEVARVHGELFRNIRPVATMVEVKRLIQPEMLVEVEVDAEIAPRRARGPSTRRRRGRHGQGSS